MNKRKPQKVFIPRNKDTEKLYQLEEKRAQVIIECAEEWQKVTGTKGDFWSEIMPQSLFDILSSYGSWVSTQAARAFLEHAVSRDNGLKG